MYHSHFHANTNYIFVYLSLIQTLTISLCISLSHAKTNYIFVYLSLLKKLSVSLCISVPLWEIPTLSLCISLMKNLFIFVYFCLPQAKSHCIFILSVSLTLSSSLLLVVVVVGVMRLAFLCFHMKPKLCCCRHSSLMVQLVQRQRPDAREKRTIFQSCFETTTSSSSSWLASKKGKFVNYVMSS